jgi:hypothetical protein
MVPVGALSLGAVLCLAPFWSDLYLGGGDLPAHLFLAASARREFVAGQWLLSFVNTAPVGLQPWFRYYSVLPYALTVPWQLMLGLPAYLAMLVTLGLLFVIAGLGMFQVSRYLGGPPFPSLIAALAYAFSPYVFDDLYFRGAFVETTFNAIVPAVFYCLLRCYATSGRRYVLPSIGMVAALFLTHKILIPWFFCVFGLYVALVTLSPAPLELRHWSTLIRRSAHVVLPVLAGSLVTAPYWLEAYVLTPSMFVSGVMNVGFEDLTEGLRIFSPLVTRGEGHLALKLGVPCFVGILLALIGGRYRRSSFATGLTGVVLAVFVAGGAALWSHVPAPFTAVQFPYRLLSLTTFLGSLGLAQGLGFVGHLLRSNLVAKRSAEAALLACTVGTGILFYAGPSPSGPPNRFWEDPSRVPGLLPATMIEAPARFAARGLSGSDLPEISFLFYADTPTDGSGALLISRDAMDFDRYTGRARITVPMRSLVILPAQFSSYLHVDVLDEANGQTVSARVLNEDGKTAVWLDSGRYLVQVTHDFLPPAIVAFAVGLALIAIVLIRRQWARFVVGRRNTQHGSENLISVGDSAHNSMRGIDDQDWLG